MKIKPFLVEEWMNTYEDDATYNIAETCVDSVSIDELFELCNLDKDQYLSEFCKRRLTYGDITGLPAFLKGITSLYKTIKEDDIVTTHGAASANHLVFSTVVEPGDDVISVIPTYQQLYSIPESLGANVKLLKLKKENGYHVDINDLKGLVTDKTTLICINNPNNPTGALMTKEELQQIVDVAKSVDAYVLCDEVYRGLTQDDTYSESICDLYDKGLSVSSMSKVFSLAGLRLGWVATKDKAFRKACISHRDYNLISCGLFDEWLASIALKNSDKLLQRNKNIVRTNLKILDDFVKTNPHLSYVKPQGGTTSLLTYDLDIPSEQFCAELFNTTGAFVVPGDCFYMDHSMRLGYACETDELIKGLEQIDKYIKSKL